MPKRTSDNFMFTVDSVNDPRVVSLRETTREFNAEVRKTGEGVEKIVRLKGRAGLSKGPNPKIEAAIAAGETTKHRVSYDGSVPHKWADHFDVYLHDKPAWG